MYQSEQEKFERILASLHEAALDDTRFPTASALIDDALGVHGNCLGLGDAPSGDDIRICYAGFFYHGQRRRECGTRVPRRLLPPGRTNPAPAASPRQRTGRSMSDALHRGGAEYLRGAQRL